MCSVHLLPCFGPTAPHDWKLFLVLDQCNTFYVNPFTAKSETMGPLIAVFEDRAEFICNSRKLMPNFKIFAVIKN